MKYHAVMRPIRPLAGDCVHGIGQSEDEAIARVFADSVTMRTINPRQIALCMYHQYDNGNVLSYACTLEQYRDSTN